MKKYPTLKETYMLNEISREESLNFYREIKQRDPELFKELITMAKLVLQLGRGEIKPRKASDTLNIYLNKYKEMDPLRSGDTLGVKMFIDKLALSKAEARGAKQYYDNIYNALLKKRYRSFKKKDK